MSKISFKDILARKSKGVPNLIQGVRPRDLAVTQVKTVPAAPGVAPGRLSLPVDPTGLLPWQPARVDVLCQSLLSPLRAALDASWTGTGKTYVAAGVCRHLKVRPVVMCPLAVIGSWKKALASMGIEPLLVCTYDKIRNGKTPFLKKSKVPGKKNKFVWYLPPDGILLFDESHRCKGQDSINARLMIAATEQNLLRQALSATAAVSPLEMRALGHMLGLFRLEYFWQWCRQRNCYQSEWGGLTFNRKDPSSKSIMLALHKQIFPKRGTRVTTADIPDFPESLITAEAYDISDPDEIQKIYDQMQSEIDSVEESTSGYSANAFASMVKARREAEIRKVPLFAELARDAVAEGSHVPIFLNFRDSIEALADRLGRESCVFIRGGQSAEERDAEVERFQRDEADFAVCQTEAGGIGVSLHDIRGEYPRKCLLSPNFSATSMVQCLGRAQRVGGKSKSVQILVYVKDTIEEAACFSVRSKLQNLSLLNDGDLRSGVRF